ncbi:reverse transcriptase domain-containing protein [Tanacetum coccineum]
MNDEPMWAANRVVAPTPSSTITIPKTANEFAIKGNQLTLVKGYQFDGRIKTDPHKHIHEFLRICDMFKYRDTKNEVVRLMMFPLSLTGEAKTWLDELNEGTIETRDELRIAFISQFFPPALFDRLLGEIRAFSQHENETLNEAWLRMKEMLRNFHGHNLSKGNIIKIFYHGLNEITQEVLNSATGDFRKLAWIKWSNILASLDKGGLGVLKWIHGNEAGIELKGCQTNGLWARIVGTIYHLHSSGYVPLNSLRYQVGDGSMIRFWKDTWLGDAPLCSRFNRLFRLEKNQNCLVRDRIVNGLWAWDWRRPVNGGRALADLNNLLMDIGSLNVEVDRDCVVSSLSTDGSYSVSFIRKHIDNCMIANSLPSTRWCKIIPRKVNIFMWRLLLDRLPHRLNLSSRGLDIDSILCPVCSEHVESNSHAFFSCSAPSNIWRLVRGWCELKIPTLSSCDEWDIWYTSWKASKVKKDRAYVIFAATCWMLWRFRNNHIFNSQDMRKCEVFDKIQCFSFSWLKSRGKKCISWTDWLKSPL